MRRPLLLMGLVKSFLFFLNEQMSQIFYFSSSCRYLWVEGFTGVLLKIFETFEIFFKAAFIFAPEL